MKEEQVYKDTVFEKPRLLYNAISAYIEVEKPEEWNNCNKCGYKPLIWEFDNGRSTSCGCGKNDYQHPSIHATDIITVMKNSENGQSMVDYDRDELRNNWNEVNSQKD